ncbi:hypothetical protein [uncultured Corynebacterium sp.]|uniref:hypothetical protein n=1 Tax=uncultured Corynebacterium sp. TaxID=159447 RepID=UPI0025F23ADA|nr:hypothetical protein [uncultured Corynebacterium sp.]
MKNAEMLWDNVVAQLSLRASEEGMSGLTETAEAYVATLPVDEGGTGDLVGFLDDAGIEDGQDGVSADWETCVVAR